MEIKTIVTLLNQKLAGERHTYTQLVPHLDAAIDAINAQLNSTFPAFSELPVGTAVYDMFPDRYIRTVVIPGAANDYFTTDEEGLAVSPEFAMQFQNGLFLMVRDYFSLVPAQYKPAEDLGQGAVDLFNDAYDGGEGLSVDGAYFHN